VISLRKLRRCLGDSCLKMFKFFKDENDPHLYFPESTTFPNLLVRGAVVASKKYQQFFSNLTARNCQVTQNMCHPHRGSSSATTMVVNRRY